MGCSSSKPAARLPVPEGTTRLCVAGFGISHHTGRAAAIARSIAATHPDEYETWFFFDSRGFRPDFLNSVKAELSSDQQEEFASHNSSPFCWLETPDGKRFAIGGRDKLCDWTLKTFKDEKDEEFLSLCKEGPGFRDAFFDNETPGTAKTE